MSKRQETVLSSSSRRETVPEKNHHHAKTIGCLSGILRLVSSKYQNRHRNRITFGRKHGKSNEQVNSPAPVKIEASLPATMMMRCDYKKTNGSGGDKMVDFRRRFSCEVPRSPTLPPEIRRSNSVNSPENFRASTPPPPALVARLMGLEEIPAEAAIAEKRKKLLGALEKCDEDLQAIKKIIESLRSTEEPERLRSPPPPVSVEGNAGGEGGGGRGDIMRNVKWCSEFNGGEERSPISVFDDFTKSPFNTSCFSKRHIINGAGRRTVQQQQQKPQPMRTNPRFIRRDVDDFGIIKCETEVASPPYLWSNKVTMNMIESVDEVCRDIAWGEKREVGRIGLVLQDYICKDLIEEIVKELGECCSSSSCMLYHYSLPLEACKRRLPF
ncbi:unnamed protein product [Camellia sinensis]